MTVVVPNLPALPDGVRRAPRSPRWMLDQLPVGMLDSEFFVRFVSIFQELGTRLLEEADNIDHILDVSVAPPELVRYLGSWIGLDSIDESVPEQLQRRIVRSAAQTLAWRGTGAGLEHYLELVSGAPARVEDGGGVWRAGDAPADTAWVRMHVQSTGWLDQADFVALVRDEVPAHVRAELYVADRRVWASEEDAT